MERKQDFSLEKIFAIIATMVGILLVFLIPPMASPDENDHLFNAYAFSDLNFFSETEGDKVGRVLPNSLIEFVEYYNIKFPQKLEEKYSYREAYESWALESDYTQFSFKEYWNADVSLAAYIPSGIGMFIYRLLANIFPMICLSNYNLLMVGRLCNLCFYICMIYYALKWTPIMKNTMFLIALLPMSIFLASTLSYDTVIIATSCLLFARVSKILKCHENVKKSDLAVIMISTFFLVNVKQAYAPLLIILFAIGTSKFGNIKRYIKYVTIVVCAGITPYAVFKVVDSIKKKGFDSRYSDVMEKQIRVILEKPFGFWKNIGESFDVFDEFYFTGFFGKLGQLDTNIPLVFIYLLALVLLIISVIEVSSQEVVSIKWRILSLVGTVLVIYLIFAGTYVIWTSTRYQVGLNYVEGVQGRYFIPLYLWMITLIGNSKLKNKIDLCNTIQVISIGTAVLSSIITLMCVFIRFWI